MLIKGGRGSGKTSLVYDIIHQLKLPCFILRSYEMTMKSGSDAYKAMEEVYAQAKQVAPAIVLIDSLQTIAADNNHKRLDRSDVDSSLLLLLSHMIKDGKENGVTVVGVMNDDAMILPSVLHSFDETVMIQRVNKE